MPDGKPGIYQALDHFTMPHNEFRRGLHQLRPVSGIKIRERGIDAFQGVHAMHPGIDYASESGVAVRARGRALFFDRTVFLSPFVAGQGDEFVRSHFFAGLKCFRGPGSLYDICVPLRITILRTGTHVNLPGATDRVRVTQMPENRTEKKNPAAVALGRKGGKKRAQNLSAEQLTEQARKAAAARWAAVEKNKRIRAGRPAR
jgi:hypothetical protein